MLNRPIVVSDIPTSQNKTKLKPKIKKGRVTNKDLDDILEEGDQKAQEQDTLNNDMMLKQHRQRLRNKMRDTMSNSPWIEKYRPTCTTDIVMDTNIRKYVDKILKDKSMPNLILTGLSGTGKTTTVLCLAKELLGKHFNECVLEMNASDDRGIKSVQDTIIAFCKKRTGLNDEYDDKDSGKDSEDSEDGVERKSINTRHKIILLDETDNMTKKAQQLVNTLMDEYKDTVRFAFTCNASNEVIEAIQSRCQILRYRRLDSPGIVDRLKYICDKEKVKYTDEGLKAVVMTSQGDIRRCVNSLQLIHSGYDGVTSKNVYKLCDVPYPLVIKKMFISCKDKDIKTALEQLAILRDGGYSASDISLSMIQTLKSDIIGSDLDEATKIKFMIEVSRTCLVITKGVNSALQLTGCVAKMCT